MSVLRHDSPHEVDEFGIKEGVLHQVIEPKRSAFHHLDPMEACVEELLQERWLRQRARQSPREGRRALEDFLRKRLLKDQVCDGNPPSWLQDTESLGKHPALSC